MACCGGGSGEAEQINRRINKELADYKPKFQSEVKLLLLGAGESGKSTIAKQMKIIHKDGFSGEEIASFKSLIYSNVFSALKTLINAAAELKVPLENQQLADKFLEKVENDAEMSPEIAQDIKAIWGDNGIKQVFERASEFQLIDSAGYYLDNCERLAQPGYTPTQQDVLRSRAKTTGIIEIEFDVEKTHFRMVDVGGQRSERKKWMHCFQDVTAVIFCVAMSEYDLKLVEDENTNRMHESMKVFKEICNSKWFTETSMILFLNKRDLFAEKIKKVDLKVCFPEYNGGLNFENGKSYIKDQFLALNTNQAKVVYPHFTCATDTDNVTVVFKSVQDMIIREQLKRAGMMSM